MNIEKFRHKRPKGGGYINLDAVLTGRSQLNDVLTGLVPYKRIVKDPNGEGMKRKQVTKHSTETL